MRSISLQKVLSMIRRSTSIVTKTIVLAIPEYRGIKQSLSFMQSGYAFDNSMISPPFICCGENVCQGHSPQWVINYIALI